MKTKHFCFAGVAFLISLVSCQKNFTPVDNQIQNPPASDSNYLDRYSLIWDQGSGLDTQEVAVFNYDNLKRVISITDSCYSCTPHSLLETYKYYYSGNDTIPNKTFYKYAELSEYDSITTNHFYDNQQRKIKDSSIRARQSGSFNYSYKIIDLYNYAPGKIYHSYQNEQILPFFDISLGLDTASSDAFGNVTENRRYAFNGTTYELKSNSFFTFDNHISPFAKLSFFKAHSGLPNGETLFFESLDYNNKVTQTEYFSGNLTLTATYNYIYNAAGYPIVCNASFGGAPEKYIFRYKPL